MPRFGRRRPSARIGTGCSRATSRVRSLMRAAGRGPEAGLLSDEHFTVDGTLLEAWASLKSFRRKNEGPQAPPDDPGNPTVNFHGESRRNDTHQSTTDPDAMLARKGAGREAKLSYAGHVLLDNRHGLVGHGCVAAATGRGGRDAGHPP